MMRCKLQHCRGLTLIETVLASVVIMVAGIASIGYRYSVSMDTCKAEDQISASRLGMMLLEGWKGWAGSSDFAPEVSYGSVLNISAAGSGLGGAHGFNILNHYKIVTDGVSYYAVLSSKEATATEPKMLNVQITWSRDRQDQTVSSKALKTIGLTTYAGN
ncbi:hypothetical protein ACFL02_04605 [Planctomycetota bacterium]